MEKPVSTKYGNPSSQSGDTKYGSFASGLVPCITDEPWTRFTLDEVLNQPRSHNNSFGMEYVRRYEHMLDVDQLHDYLEREEIWR